MFDFGIVAVGHDEVHLGCSCSALFVGERTIVVPGLWCEEHGEKRAPRVKAKVPEVGVRVWFM